MKKLVHGIPVYGEDLKPKTECAHYHSEFDIIAIQFKCCGRYFACYTCHEVCGQCTSHHEVKMRWLPSEFDTPAVLCGSCGVELTIKQYLTCQSSCPNCFAAFNSRCRNHWHLYFELEAS